jgi:hypothetical protein
MDATTYTGNGSTQTITNASAFKPDLVWVKCRSAAKGNILNDSVRGAGKLLSSESTAAESGNSGDLIGSFNSNGFQVNLNYAGGSNDASNQNGGTFVGWQWQAGQGTNTTNTSGSITSTVSVNTTAGFSIVTYTNTASGVGTVGHGLGIAPKMIVVKKRDTSSSFSVYHASLANTQFLQLEATIAATTSANRWNSTSPTSTVFSLGSDWIGSATAVAYCWAEIAGFSKFGSYTGNASANGTFVYTGFRPKFVMTKGSGTVSVWSITDASRNTYNLSNNFLQPNATTAEAATGEVDILSNGFKLRGTNSSWNGSSTYIYMAFAENPFKNANAR